MVISPSEAEKQEIRARLLNALRTAESLRVALARHVSLEAKVEWLLKQNEVTTAFARYPDLEYVLSQGRLESMYVLGLMVLLGQFDRLFYHFETLDHRCDAVRCCLDILIHTEDFYQPIGGLLGYYGHVVRLLSTAQNESLPLFRPPPVRDMREKTAPVWTICYEGVKGLPTAGVIFTVGGAGDRLNLVDRDTGVLLPAARLVFGGRTLLEGLFRDLQALEYWYYRVFGHEVSIPVVLMTSHEKNNAEAIERLGREHAWFGKSTESIFSVVQPLVPMITEDGQFASAGPAQLVAKPGGHGVIWKLAHDVGVFTWLSKKKVSALVVRQINNPLCGLDHTLLSLLGVGISENKSFGFAAVPRHQGFAEGLNVLIETKNGEVGISNIEYTKFEALQKVQPQLLEHGCPANTNILFADIAAVLRALQRDPIPGMVLNAKNVVSVVERDRTVQRSGVRLESMMQSIADAMTVPVTTPCHEEDLPTFIALYERQKAMSVTKRALQEGGNPYETPESCLYDWCRACRLLLQNTCAFELPDEISLEQFLREGPRWVFFFHPSLGPLWEVIGQKLHGGKLFPGAEMELEIAELFARNLSVQGSFRLLCEEVMGRCDSEGVRHCSPNVGRAFLRNVSIDNAGVLPSGLGAHLSRSIERDASCTIRLLGASELIAEDLVIRGSFTLTVRDGVRATLRQRSDGGVDVIEEPYVAPRWTYAIAWHTGTAPSLRVLSTDL